MERTFAMNNLGFALEGKKYPVCVAVSSLLRCSVILVDLVSLIVVTVGGGWPPILVGRTIGFFWSFSLETGPSVNLPCFACVVACCFILSVFLVGRGM